MTRTTLRAPLLLVMLFGFMGAAPALAISYSKIKTITSATFNIPPSTSPPWSLDIGWVDPSARRYYLADRTNNAVDVVNTLSDTFVGQIGKDLFAGFTGNNDTSGPNGVLVLDKPHQLWVGDGGSTVKVFDLNGAGDDASSTAHCHPPLPSDCVIPTGGSNRADELTYDARNKLIVVANDAESPAPFLSFISVQTRQVVGRIDFPNATDGIEQPLYDPQTHKIFQAVPQTAANAGGEIDVIEPGAMKVTKVHPLQGCTPHGLAFGPNRNLLVGCNGGDLSATDPLVTIVMDSRNGHLVATITQVGGSDEVWYDSNDPFCGGGQGCYYTASNRWTSNGLKGGSRTPVLGIIDAGTNTWLQNVATSVDSHSVAADPNNNHVYVPLDRSATDGGIGVFAGS